MSAAQRIAGAAAQAAGLWIGRKRADPRALAEARASVANLKPIVLVTGGSRGLGAALAERFATAGSDVALVARNADELESTARAIAARTARAAIAIPHDLTAPGTPAALATLLAERGYYVDILINNAGTGLSGPFEGQSADDIQRLIALNIATLTALTQYWLPDMRARRHGGILNVASLGGAVPGPYQAVYYASKSYVLSLTEAIASETTGEGVRVSALAPGPLETGFHSAMNADRSLYRRLIPALTPERAAREAYLGYSLGRRVIVPGLGNTLGYIAVRLLPHTITTPIIRVLLAPRSKV
ncbi:MAG: SDR family NAD(P)-dependent oxidoreductase [Hyphomicrobium sp.]